MKNLALAMADTEPQAAASSSVSWLAWDASVEHGEDKSRLVVGGYVVGEFSKKDTLTRNLLLIGLSQEQRFSKVELARSFHITDERLLQLRRAYESGGVEALMPRMRTGRRPKAAGAVQSKIIARFAAGKSALAVYEELGAESGLSLRTIERMRSKWSKGEESLRPEGKRPVAVPCVQAAQQELPLLAVGAAQSQPEVEPEIETMIGSAPQPAIEDERGNAIPAAEPRGERHVLNAGCLLLIAMVFSLGLHESVLSGWKTSAGKLARLRAIVDALIAALGIGQRCVEGVRRLEHPTGKALLRADNVPSESGTRMLLKEYLAEVGGSDAHLKMTQRYLARARLEDDTPAVFYIDNHMRPYTGKRRLQKGWRMQDKRVRTGTCDYYVHDEDGRPLLRVDVPMHDALGDWLKPIAALLRQKLGDTQRILLAFDRGGAFPKHLAPLCERGFEFVTYERAPYPLMPKEAFVETIELEDETLLACEESVALDDSGMKARRLALRTQDDRQINVLASSSLPMARLVEIITGRWVQENAFKHANERWGSNQLDCRKKNAYDPRQVIVNPARKRLEQALLIARESEGTVRRKLARAKGNKRDSLRAELAELLGQQKTLEAERKTTPRYAYLKDTELADKLVYVDTHYKTLLDTVRIACVNAESDLADLLRPSLAKPREAKMVLQNIFKSQGHIRVHDDRIDLTLDLIGNDNERRAAKLFAAQLNRLRLALPGDTRTRPLCCRFQM